MRKTRGQEGNLSLGVGSPKSLYKRKNTSNVGKRSKQQKKVIEDVRLQKVMH